LVTRTRALPEIRLDASFEMLKSVLVIKD
jgi:hypothetical protein